MRSRWGAYLLLFAIFWQCLAVAANWAPMQAAQGFEHAVLHGQTTEHHHHDDASVHVEETDGALAHQHADGGFNTPGCLPNAGFSGLAFRQVVPTDWANPLAPSADLDAWLRPPRPTV